MCSGNEVRYRFCCGEVTCGLELAVSVSDVESAADDGVLVSKTGNDISFGEIISDAVSLVVDTVDDPASTVNGGGQLHVASLLRCTNLFLGV